MRVFSLPSSRLLRFLIVGGLNSVFGFAVFSLLIVLGAGTWLSLIGANVAGSLFNFFTYGGLVFRDLAGSRLPCFLLCYVLVLALNAWLISVLEPLVGGRITAQAILTFPIALLSYLAMSRLVFRTPD